MPEIFSAFPSVTKKDLPLLSVTDDKSKPFNVPLLNDIELPEFIELFRDEDNVIVVPTIDVTVVPDATPEPITKSPTQHLLHQKRLYFELRMELQMNLMKFH